MRAVSSTSDLTKRREGPDQNHWEHEPLEGPVLPPGAQVLVLAHLAQLIKHKNM